LPGLEDEPHPLFDQRSQRRAFAPRGALGLLKQAVLYFDRGFHTQIWATNIDDVVNMVRHPYRAIKQLTLVRRDRHVAFALAPGDNGLDWRRRS
jgi:hypothetical protein